MEQLVDELNLPPNLRTAHLPRLPLPDHVNCLVSLFLQAALREQLFDIAERE